MNYSRTYQMLTLFCGVCAVICVIFSVNMFQLDRFALGVGFSCLSLFVLVITTILTFDYFDKQTIQVNSDVVSVKRNEIQVLMPNQSIRTIRILKSEQTQYFVNQQVTLTLTRRTKQLISVNK